MYAETDGEGRDREEGGNQRHRGTEICREAQRRSDSCVSNLAPWLVVDVPGESEKRIMDGVRESERARERARERGRVREGERESARAREGG